MRYIGLLLFFLSIPVLAAAIKANANTRRVVWVLLGASPFIYGWAHLSVSLVSWVYWPGYVKGILIALPDLLAVGLLLSTPKRPIRHGVLVMLGLYIAAVLASMLVSDLPFASFMYAWQLMRVFLVAAAVARISVDSDAPRHIVYGLCYGIIFQAGFSVYQHFGQGIAQAPGTMGHQNLLGMMTHFALLIPLALMLTGDKAAVLKAGVGSALITIALTASRGTLGFAVAGIVLLVLFSLLRRPTAKKMRIVGAGAALMLVVAPVAYLTLQNRFAKSSLDGTYNERDAFERAARAMWTDHPFGVGANEYVVIANTKGYSARAGVIWTSGSRSANVHNAYLLIAAETGWLGLISFILFYVTAVLVGLRAAWSKPVSPDRELALGPVVVLLTVAMHNFFEWIFVLEYTQYLLGISLGFIMGLGMRSAVRRRPRRAEPLFEPASPIDPQPLREVLR
ncbi:O-antigen ligase family protein [Sphingomonas sp. XXL09]|uniref:O-antigen ligase family protein n=1 Tax=Sphingomonas sp. XXL09 TaxID=3457787 RepID=UPI00406BCD03